MKATKLEDYFDKFKVDVSDTAASAEDIKKYIKNGIEKYLGVDELPLNINENDEIALDKDDIYKSIIGVYFNKIVENMSSYVKYLLYKPYYNSSEKESIASDGIQAFAIPAAVQAYLLQEDLKSKNPDKTVISFKDIVEFLKTKGIGANDYEYFTDIDLVELTHEFEENPTIYFDKNLANREF